MRRLIIVAIVATMAFTACKSPDRTLPDPVNYIQIDGGQKQEITSAYFKDDGGWTRFAVSALEDKEYLLDYLAIDIPNKFMGTEYDLATDEMLSDEGNGSFWLGQRNGLWWGCEYWTGIENATGKVKVIKNEEGNYTIDLIDIACANGKLVTIHYEGTMTEEDANKNHFETYITITFDIEIDGTRVFGNASKSECSNYPSDKDGKRVSNFWFEGVNTYCDIFMTRKDGGTFIEGDYSFDATSSAYIESHSIYNLYDSYNGVYIVTGALSADNLSTSKITFTKSGITKVTFKFQGVKVGENVVTGTYDIEMINPLDVIGVAPANLAPEKRVAGMRGKRTNLK